MIRTERGALPLLLAVAIIVATASCGASPKVIAADAQPVVDRLRAAPSPQQWTFTYQPDSASPYLACLGGIDEARGAIDLDAGLLRLTPNRDAPPVIVTKTSLLVPDANLPQAWLEVPWTPTLDQARLRPRFGEVLASYISTGLRAPDLNMTALAAIDIATSVDSTDAPFGLNGEAINITIDANRYLRDLEANASTTGNDERNRIPTLTTVVDPLGRATAIIVDAGGTAQDPTEAEHRDRYIITANYDELDPIALPPATDRQPADLDDIAYPSPEASCTFRS